MNQNYFYHPHVDEKEVNPAEKLAKEMVKIPYSKSDIFTSEFLTFAEKRQLVKIIEVCMKSKQGSTSVNSTHVYDKETQMTAD